MIYQLTIKHADGSTEHRTAIGAIGPIVDELYDAGAKCIFYRVKP